MSTVTYHKQPGIHKTRGTVGVEGTDHVYKVSGILWPNQVEKFITSKFIGSVLHVCCGNSKIGDVLVDLYANGVDVQGDAARLPFAGRSFDTVVIDPPYNGKFQWNHDMLNELHRVADKRIIFQHWFCPVNKKGQFRKANVFRLTEAVAAPYVVEEDYSSDSFMLDELFFWTPRTYFGRVQLISILDRETGNGSEAETDEERSSIE